VVGVSVFTCKLQSAHNVLKQVREYNPRIKTCVGGAHVTAVPEDFISHENVDAVFVGYADRAFPDWLGAGCPNGVFHGSVSHEELDALPYVRREALLFPEAYTSKDLSILFAGRGCVGKCIFCSNSFMWKGRPYIRKGDSFEKEVVEMKEKWGVDYLRVKGDSLSDIPTDSQRIVDVLGRHRLPWEANVRWATVTGEIIDNFTANGCKKIFVGLESGTDKLLRYMKKGCTKEIIRKKAHMLNAKGVQWHHFCIVGFPIETVEDMRETLDFVLEIQPTSVSHN
jgi:radical SAM superfamily enzyme YgiQ (UPF0313 family)